MPKVKKSWTEKLHTSHDLPKVVKLNAKQSRQWGKGTLAIPAPIEVDGFMKKVPKGKVSKKILKTISKNYISPKNWRRYANLHWYLETKERKP